LRKGALRLAKTIAPAQKKIGAQVALPAGAQRSYKSVAIGLSQSFATRRRLLHGEYTHPFILRNNYLFLILALRYRDESSIEATGYRTFSEGFRLLD
jgi:hypothetical protein